MELKCLFMEFSRVFSLSSVFNRVVPNSVVVARLIAERILEVDAESVLSHKQSAGAADYNRAVERQIESNRQI